MLLGIKQTYEHIIIMSRKINDINFMTYRAEAPLVVHDYTVFL